MAMNGIDISNWQRGIDLTKVPFDFAICKATQGTGYTSPDCVRQVESIRALGKPFGVYHYIGGGNAEAEVDHFVDSVLNWVKNGILALDWEGGQNAAWGDYGYLERCVKRVIDRTGVKPVIYAQKSVYNQTKAVADKYDCGMWVAQYANKNITGYQETPWNEGAYTCVIRQYSSKGRLAGYGGDLDLDKGYLDAAAWAKYANPQATPVAVDTPNPQDPGNCWNDSMLWYRAHVSEYGWLDAVRDGQVAGTTGKAVPLEAFKLDLPEGLELMAKIHVQNEGWKKFEHIKAGARSGEGSSENDPIIGTVGKALHAEAIELDIEKNTTGKRLRYQVHLADTGWTGWIDAGFTAGTVGINKAIEAIRIVLGEDERKD